MSRPADPGDDRQAILARLRSLVGDKIDIDPAALTFGTKLGDVGVDSFSLIELIFLAEEEFGIRIPLEGTAPATVDEVVDLIEAQLDSAKAGPSGAMRPLTP